MLACAKFASSVENPALDSAKPSMSELSVLGQNSLRLLAALPKQSLHRRALFSFLLRGFGPARAAQIVANSSPSAVEKSLAGSFDAATSPLLTQKYPAGTHRTKTATALKTEVAQFVKDACPPRSGTAREHYQQKRTSNDLFSDFLAAWPDITLRLARAGPSDEAAYRALKAKARESAAMITFLQITRPPAPGQRQPLYRSFVCHRDFEPRLIDLILSFVCAFPLRPPSRSTFDKLKGELPLSRVRLYHGEFECRTCATLATDENRLKLLNARESDLHAGELAERERLLIAIESARRHHAVHLHQAAALRATLSELGAGEACVQLDFGSLNRRPNVADKYKALIPVLMLVMHSRNASSGQLERNYIAFMSQDRESAKNRFLFYRIALLFLLSSPLAASLRRLCIWSDTSAKDFRSRHAQRLEAELSHLFGVCIERGFTAARHGRSLCDAMLGVLAQLCNRALLKAEAIRDKVERKAKRGESCNVTHDELAKLLTPFCHPLDLLPLMRRVQKLTAVVLPRIEGTEQLKPAVSPLKGIMGMHALAYPSLREVRLSERTFDEHGSVVQWRRKGDLDANTLMCFSMPLQLASPPSLNLAAVWRVLDVSWQVTDTVRPLAVQGPLAPALHSILPSSALPASEAASASASHAKASSAARRKRKHSADSEWLPHGKRVNADTDADSDARSWQNDDEDEFEEDFPPKEVLEWYFKDFDA